MQVNTITMDAAEAKARLEQYQDDRLTQHIEEADQIEAAYKALAKGTALINAAEAIATAGLDDAGLPLLAIARADWQWCHVDSGARRRGESEVAFWRTQPGWTAANGGRVPAARVWMKCGRAVDRAKALVPIIPPDVRALPGCGLKISNYHILFEAEWQPVAPKDPLLLRRVHGDLFAVLAEWDLTEVERAVLAGRFRRDDRG